MSVPVALAVSAALFALTVVVGVILRHREGRRRSGGHLRVDPADVALDSGVTLVQFSTELCARCPQVRRMLRSVADSRRDLNHVEVDLTHRPDLATRYHVLQTPTTFLVDADGTVRARFNGVPQQHALTEALAAVAA